MNLAESVNMKMFKSPVFPTSLLQNNCTPSMASLQVPSLAPVSFAPRSKLSTFVTHQSPTRATNNQGGRSGESGDKPKVAWKTIPCWHYVKKKGACPHDGYCCFVHDMQFAAVLERDKEYEKKVSGIEKASHCWAYIQGRCRNSNCSYLHPKNTKPYVPYTPCINFSRCDQTPYCQFQHPEWVYTRSLIREKDKIAQSAYFETLATISGIPIQYGGTTYFPRSTLSDSYTTPFSGRLGSLVQFHGMPQVIENLPKHMTSFFSRTKKRSVYKA